MLSFQVIFAWSWIAAGMASGAVLGLYFHNKDFMGGYNSWRRRLVRLGHIAFIGTALLNIACAFTLKSFPVHASLIDWPVICMVIGAITMPLICGLAAWNKPCRHLFFIPVLALLGGVLLTLYALIQSGGVS